MSCKRPSRVPLISTSPLKAQRMRCGENNKGDIGITYEHWNGHFCS